MKKLKLVSSLPLRFCIVILMLFISCMSGFSQNTLFCGETVTVTNEGGENNLENYPIRPQFSFLAPEGIYAFPVGECGEICVTTSNRMGSAVTDIFVVTDPNDASTNVLRVNGAGATDCFIADPNTDYYLIMDGVNTGSIGTIDVTIACSVACDPPNAAPIPTLGQWGLILMSILILILGLVTMTSKSSNSDGLIIRA